MAREKVIRLSDAEKVVLGCLMKRAKEKDYENVLCAFTALEFAQVQFACTSEVVKREDEAWKKESERPVTQEQLNGYWSHANCQARHANKLLRMIEEEEAVVPTSA